MDYEDLLARISERLEKLKLSERKACLNAGLPVDAIRNIRRGFAPKIATIQALARTLDVSVSYFTESPDLEGAEYSDLTAGAVLPAPEAHILDFAGLEYGAVGVYDAKVSAGPGALNTDYPKPDGYRLFPLSWLRGISSADPSMLAILTVAGDSMEPTLENGDQILIDRSVQHLGRDGLYVLVADHEAQVKRLSRDPRDRSVTIRSDNPKSESWTGVDEEMVHVLGRVLWLGRKLEG